MQHLILKILIGFTLTQPMGGDPSFAAWLFLGGV
jgi:hypothetical protein